MSKIIAIVALGPGGLISIDGKMPWDVPEDLRRFRALTINNTVVMGRKTWESLGKRCLPNRTNYVLSKEGNFNVVADSAAVCFTNVNYAILDSNLRFPNQDVFIIGGAQIYKETLPIWDELYLTIINKDLVKYIHGSKTYLGFDVHDYEFIEVASDETEYATYKKYIRKVTNPKTKDKLF